MEGEVPYRDFFEFITPGSIYLAGLLFSIFGTSLFVAKAMAILSASGIVFFVSKISMRLLRTTIYSLIPPLLTLFYAFPTWPYYSYQWLSVLCALMALWSILPPERSLTWHLVSGLFSSISFLFLQHRGIVIALSLMASSLLGAMIFNRERKRLIRELAIFLFGFITPLTIFFFYLYITSSLGYFLYDAFIWVFQGYLHYFNYSSYYLPGKLKIIGFFEQYPFFIALIKARMVIAFGYLPILLYSGYSLYFIIRGWKRHLNPEDIVLLYCFVGGLGMFLTGFHRSDYLHMSYASPWLWLLLAHSLDIGSQRRGISIFTKSLTILIFLEILYRPCQQLRDCFSYSLEVTTKRGALFFKDEKDARVYKEILKFLDDIPQSDDVFIYYWSHHFYYFAGRRSPTRYCGIRPNYNTEDQIAEVVSVLKFKDIKYIIYDSVDKLLLAHPKGRLILNPETVKAFGKENPLTRFVKENYVVLKAIGHYTIYRKAHR